MKSELRHALHETAEQMPAITIRPDLFDQAWRTKRRRFAALTAAGAATLAVAGVVAVGAAGPSATPRQAIETNTTDSQQAPNLQLVSASTVLHQASLRAAGKPFTEPRDDQFVYSKTDYAGGGIDEVWMSVDDTHDGYIIKSNGSQRKSQGCRDGRRSLEDGGTEACKPIRAYVNDLPTTVDAMIAHLQAYRKGGGGELPPGSKTGWDVVNTGQYIASLERQYLSPSTQAVLFEAASRLPGFTVVKDVKVNDKTVGVGISWARAEGGRSMLVFDTSTYDYLGSGFSTAGQGDSLTLQQRVTTAIVDRVMQRP
jgi:hypothetical protein